MPSGEDEEIIERDETLLLVIALPTAQSLRRGSQIVNGVNLRDLGKASFRGPHYDSPMLVARRPSAFLFRHTLAFLTGLGKTDRDGLLAALHFTALASAAAFRGALLVPAHFAFDVSLRAASIFGLLL